MSRFARRLQQAAPGITSSNRMPVGNLPGWTQVVAEDFIHPTALGAFPDSYYWGKVFPYNTGSHDTSGRGTNDASKVYSAHDSYLDTWLHTESGVHYIGEAVPTNPNTGWGQLYGRFSIRMKCEATDGYKIAYMLWPDSDVWTDGEVDFPEVNILAASEQIGINIYDGGWTNHATGVELCDGNFHTFTVEWVPGRLTFFIDGVQNFTTTARVPTTSHHFIMQSETVIDTSYPVPNAAAGHILVDWMCIWEYTP